ncbi:ACT domain-containing protein [archaeon]|nr:ACT domain-containing protein [archaeon]
MGNKKKEKKKAKIKPGRGERIRGVNARRYVGDYIRKHPGIRECVGKGVINYSKLSRLIQGESKVHLSFDAVVAACKREGKKLGGLERSRVTDVLSQSKVEVKNKRGCLIVKKNGKGNGQGNARDGLRGIEGCELIETVSSYILLYDGNASIKDKVAILGLDIAQEHCNVVEIVIKCPEDIEQVPGVLGYLYSIFGEHGINVLEAVSCWTDTIIVIKEEDIGKIVDVLRF